ncbi:MAG: alpha/beta hydrolase family protein [Balneolales bacterium]
MFYTYLIIPLSLFLVTSVASISKNEINTEGPEVETPSIWEEIEPFFAPPEEFEGVYGKYRTPLKFYDGRSVNTPQDWQERREEIRGRWHEMMGAWPPFMDDHEMEILETTRRENFTQHRIEFYWTPNEKTEGYLLIPDGDEEKPAVISVYYEPETAVGLGVENRDYAYQLAKRGFVTLSIGTTQATEARTYSLYYPDIENAEVEPLSMLGYAAANSYNLLADMPEVDADRIGIVGHSFGGKWAMFASSLYDKFACAVWSDPGIVFEESRPSVNYWEPWYLGYHPQPWRERGVPDEENPAQGLYPELVDGGYDLHELHALMAPRPFLVSGGSEDPIERWIPLNHSIAVNNLLGYENRVAMTNRPEHSPNPESNEQIYLFFEYFLKYNSISSKKP